MYELNLGESGYPELLSKISGAPLRLYVRGAKLTDFSDRPHIGIVGSRKLTDYGREVTKTIAGELARRGVIVVSGLALGIDSVAHQAAIEAGGTTLAVLPSTLEKIYPASHHGLAKQIIESGGALITEYSSAHPANKGSFVARNRIISGLCCGLLLTEAAEKSGSLHTANFALEQGRDVMVVPGSIFSQGSKGTNNLLKAGAAPITTVQDVLDNLNLDHLAPTLATNSDSPEEAVILTALEQGQIDTQLLFEITQLPINLFNQTLTALEINGRVARSGGSWILIA